MQKISERTEGGTSGIWIGCGQITGLTKVLAGILFFILLHNPGHVFGVTSPGQYGVTLAWDRNPSPAVAGYRVHYGTASGNYSASVEAGSLTTNTVPGLADGVPYYFTVTAYDTNGLESVFSKELVYVPGVATVQLRVATNRQANLTLTGKIGHTYDIQVTQNFTTWTVIGTVTLGTDGSGSFTDTNAVNLPKRFYRTRDTQP